MLRTARISRQFVLAAALGLTCLVSSMPAHAQITGSFNYDYMWRGYYITGDAEVSGDLGDNEVFVGKDNGTDFNTLTGITLTVSGTPDGLAGARINWFGGFYPLGSPSADFYLGLNAFGDNRVNFTGGRATYASALDNSLFDITGGRISNLSSYGSSSVTISNGRVGGLYSNGNSAVTISGGTIDYAISLGNSTLSLAGGTFEAGTVYAGGTSTLNLAGSFATTVSDAYVDYYQGENRVLRDYAITGTLSDGTAFQQTIHAAASGASVTANAIQLRGEYYNQPGNLYVTADSTLNQIVNKVVVGRNEEETLNTSPTVQLNEGLNAARVTAYNDSQLTMDGGLAQEISLEDNSVLVITGGSFDSVSAQENSTVNFLGDAQGNIFAWGNSTANIQGGTLLSVGSGENGTVNITDGTVSNARATDDGQLFVSGGNVERVFVWDNGQALLSGGSYGELGGADNSRITLTGGLLASGPMRFYDQAGLTLFGSNLSFALTGTGSDDDGDYTMYSLFGTLQDGQALNDISLFDYSNGGAWTGGGNALTFTAGVATVPEPSALALLGMALPLGIRLLHRRRKVSSC